MAAGDGAALRAGGPQPLSDYAGRQWRHAWRTRPPATGGSVPTMWSSRSHADGSWYAVVEHEFGLGEDAPVVMADAARHSAALERDSASANAGQGGTFSRVAATRTGAARPSGAESARLVGCLSM